MKQSNGSSRYQRNEHGSASSRYSRSENNRSSRYADKASGEDARSAARNDVRRAAAAAREAGEAARVQAEREERKVQEARAQGRLRAGAVQQYSRAKSFAAALTGQLGQREPLAVVVTVLAFLLVIGYIAAGIFFARHFYPGTTIYGINCSAKNVEWVKEMLDEKINTYTLTVQERENRNEMITAEQIGLHYRDQGAVEKRMSQQYSFIWPAMMLIRRSEQTQIGTEYDPAHVDEVMNRLNCFRPENIVQPEDAYIGESPDGYVVCPEVMGTVLDREQTRNALIGAIDKGEISVSLEDAHCYSSPEIYQDNEQLQADVAARNALLGADITLLFGSRREIIDTPRIMTFISEYDRSGYQIDPDKVRSYVAELAGKYDTFGGTRTFHTTIGTEETLYGGDYGWAIDQIATSQELLEEIRAKEVLEREPTYMYTAKSREINDIGDTYIEICISLQEMWCYVDGYLLVDTPVVTGNPSRGNATPSGGVWCIDAKMQDYVLVGEGYRSPVDYWMPFNGNVGIHDMQSRYYFGGTIYQYSGSHGCVNTPLDAVREIYENVSIGTPVIVYE